MKKTETLGECRICLLAAVALCATTILAQTTFPVSEDQSKGGVTKAYSALPLLFEANTGFTDPRVSYVARGSGYARHCEWAKSALRCRARRPRWNLRGANSSAGRHQDLSHALTQRSH